MAQGKKSTKRRRDRGISVWVDGAEHELLERAAAKQDDPVSTWLRKLGLREARKGAAL